MGKNKNLHVLLMFAKGGTSADAGDKYGMSNVEAVETARSAIQVVCKTGGIGKVPDLREVHGSAKWQNIIQLTIERLDQPERTRIDRREGATDRRSL